MHIDRLYFLRKYVCMKIQLNQSYQEPYHPLYYRLFKDFYTEIKSVLHCLKSKVNLYSPFYFRNIKVSTEDIDIVK